jgi:hypothetical protein
MTKLHFSTTTTGDYKSCIPQQFEKQETPNISYSINILAAKQLVSDIQCS